MAVIFAIWLDQMFFARSPDPDPGVAGASVGASVAVDAEAGTAGWWRRLPGPRGWRSDIVLPLIPPLAVIVLQVVLLAGGSWFPHFLHVPGAVTRSSLWPLAAFLTVPERHRRLGHVARGAPPAPDAVPARLGGARSVIADLVLFNSFIQGSPDPHGATDDSPTANALAAFVAAQGPGPAGEDHRMAMFDPDRYYSVATDRLGQPDLTILRGLSSVQGYGAVVDAKYNRATQTHTQLDMKPAALGDQTFAQLDLGVLATVPEYFVHLVVAAPGRAPERHRRGHPPAPRGAQGRRPSRDDAATAHARR